MDWIWRSNAKHRINSASYILSKGYWNFSPIVQGAIALARDLCGGSSFNIFTWIPGAQIMIKSSVTGSNQPSTNRSIVLKNKRFLIKRPCVNTSRQCPRSEAYVYNSLRSGEMEPWNCLVGDQINQHLQHASRWFLIVLSRSQESSQWEPKIIPDSFSLPQSSLS